MVSYRFVAVFKTASFTYSLIGTSCLTATMLTDGAKEMNTIVGMVYGIVNNYRLVNSITDLYFKHQLNVFTNAVKAEACFIKADFGSISRH